MVNVETRKEYEDLVYKKQILMRIYESLEKKEEQIRLADISDDERLKLLEEITFEYELIADKMKEIALKMSEFEVQIEEN